jgi:hypothetical protein
MVADRAGTSGSCQALRMMMRVASPIGRRIGEGGGQMHHSGFEQADFHSFGLFLPVDWSRKRAGSEYARPFPQLKPKALILKRSPQTTPLHSALNAGSVPEHWLARVLLVRPFAALGWLGSSFVIARTIFWATGRRQVTPKWALVTQLLGQCRMVSV